MENESMLIVILQGIQSDIKEMRTEFRREIDDLKAFKWKVMGMATLVSAVVPIAIIFIFNI